MLALAISVVHLSTNFKAGGAAIAAHRINCALINSGVRSKLVFEFYGYKQPTVNHFERVICRKVGRVMTSLLKKRLSVSLLGLFSNRELIRQLNENPSTIVHLHWVCDELLSYRDISKIKSKKIWSLHDMWPLLGLRSYDSEGIGGLLYRLIDRSLEKNKRKFFFNNIDIVICHSQWMKTYVESIKPKESKTRVEIIPYPIPRDFIAEKNILIKKHMERSSKLSIAFGAVACDQDRRKGLHIFIDAVNELSLKFKKNLEILIFGNVKPIRADAFADGVKVSSFGKVDSYTLRNVILNQVHMVCIPSEADNYPLVGIEALVTGCAVVGTPVGGIPEIAMMRGAVACSASAEAFFEAMTDCYTLMISQDLQSYLREQKAINEYFSEIRISKNLSDIYKAISN